MRKATCTATVFLALCAVLAGLVWIISLPVPCRYSLMFWIFHNDSCHESDWLYFAWVVPLALTSFIGFGIYKAASAICDELNKRFEARKRNL